MPNISDVLRVNTREILEHRDTKYCVCLSASGGKYFYINTNHRDMYDDFEIESSEYAFLGVNNRFVSCAEVHHFDSDKIIETVGNLNRDDMLKIKNKIQNSKILNKRDKDSVMPELTRWLLGDI